MYFNMKRPFAQYRPFGPFASFTYGQGSSIDRITRRLSRWGAKGISTTNIRDKTTIDFHTPMPGDQPIKSSLTLNDRGVTSGVLRYGVLRDEFRSGPHPSEDIIKINKLKRAVRRPDQELKLPHSVDYGDTNQFRPHIRMGDPFIDLSENIADVPEVEIVKPQGQDTQNVDGVIDFMTSLKPILLREFKGSWDI